jgi:hypothetical protein
MIRDARLSAMASHLRSAPMEARWERRPRLVAPVRSFVVVPFSVVTPRRAGAAVGLPQMQLAAAPRARSPADLAADDLMAASQ